MTGSVISEPMEPSADAASYVEKTCLPFLRNAQNQDGGWGFRTGSESRVEATSWAVLALVNHPNAEVEEYIRRGIQYLRTAQLPDGSWPATPKERIGCWVTSLACWVLAEEKDCSQAVTAGLNWLCQDWPRDSNLWGRLLRKFTSEPRISPMNPAYRGWGWTPQTSSWVEPTAYALLALQKYPPEFLPRMARRRQQLAVEMLYDRMCPGGGWNCGNPLVYGVAGDPLITPTAWALLALRNFPERPLRGMSLDWLEKHLPEIKSPGSLALARLTLGAYSRNWPGNAPTLQEPYEKNGALQSIVVTAWLCLAWGAKGNWLEPATPNRP